MQIFNLEQSGPQWHAWRALGLGGSDAPSVMEENPFCSRDELALTKLGKRKVKETARMARGKRLEPIARAAYIQMTGINMRPVCVVHDEYPWLRASLDGLSDDNKIVLEIKCPLSPSGHHTALAGRVPDHYWAQVQHQLAATGCPVLHFFSFTDQDDFLPEDRCALVKVLPDPEYIERLIHAERLFWERYKAEESQGV